MKISYMSVGTTICNQTIELVNGIPETYTYFNLNEPEDKWKGRRFCYYCDTQIMADDRRCPHCGASVRQLRVDGDV